MSAVERFGSRSAKIGVIDEDGKKIITVAQDDYARHLQLLLFFGGEKIEPDHVFPLAPENLTDEWLRAAQGILEKNSIRGFKRVNEPKDAIIFQFLSDLAVFAVAMRDAGYLSPAAKATEAASQSAASEPTAAASSAASQGGAVATVQGKGGIRHTNGRNVRITHATPAGVN